MNSISILEKFYEDEIAYRARQNQLLAYWCKLFPNMSYSPKDLYGAVVKGIQEMQVPGLEAGHVLFPQSGPFSPERLYLQLRRERIVFEICGAPFGTGFFVSSRAFDRRKQPGFLDYVVLFIAMAMFVGIVSLLGFAAGSKWGWVWGVIGGTGIIALAWTIVRLAATETIGWLDRILRDLPFIGRIYESFFHPETYYREDLSNSYRDAVHNAVMQAIDEMTKQKGLTALTPEERRPIIRDLTRR